MKRLTVIIMTALFCFAAVAGCSHGRKEKVLTKEQEENIDLNEEEFKKEMEEMRAKYLEEKNQ